MVLVEYQFGWYYCRSLSRIFDRDKQEALGSLGALLGVYAEDRIRCTFVQALKRNEELSQVLRFPTDAAQSAGDIKRPEALRFFLCEGDRYRSLSVDT
jgi:hypothetical protein